MKPSVRIHIGDVRKKLAGFEDGSVHCCVTSPPYWGLRSYLPDDSPLKEYELGSEKTPEEWCERQVEVFREVWRVLRDDGTLWLNVGDCYASGGRGAGGAKQQTNLGSNLPPQKAPIGYKPGDRIQQGAMLSEALRRDGWYLRQVIVWAKAISFNRFEREAVQTSLFPDQDLAEEETFDSPGSCMPESANGWRWERCRVKVEPRPSAKAGTYGGEFAHGLSRQAGCRDEGGLSAKWADCPGCPKCEKTGGLVLRKGNWRPTNSWEYLYQLTKGDSFGDREAVAEAAAETRSGNNAREYGAACGRKDSNHQGASVPWEGGTRNLRSVWRIATKGYPGAHYATYPLELPVVCIKASTSWRGVCPECGAPWARVVEKPRGTPDPARAWDTDPGSHGVEKCRGPESQRRVALNRGNARKAGGEHDNPFATTRTIGWLPTCECAGPPQQVAWDVQMGLLEYEPIPATILDPYGGSGTTAEAAALLGRNAVVIDLDPRNERLIRKRLRRVGLACEVIPRPTKSVRAVTKKNRSKKKRAKATPRKKGAKR